jgi:uncharacterized alpha-E superfamily protein
MLKLLSRAAERVYWTGRYLERAENTARIVQQYSQLLLDLPEEVGIDWTELVRICGAHAMFTETGRDGTEREVLHFLLAESGSPSSLTFSLRMARENIRNTRDLLPHEAWENVNELYQTARERLPLAARSDERFEELADCIGRCQQINGSLTSTMSHLAPYHFLMLGQCIERADMTSRIIDVATAYIRHNERLVRRYGSSLWTNILKSVSGFQMYRQHIQPEVEGSKVIDFLLRDAAFPRSIGFCLATAKATTLSLPRPDETDAALDIVRGLLDSSDESTGDADSVSQLMDTLQKRLGDVHARIVATWFLPEAA